MKPVALDSRISLLPIPCIPIALDSISEDAKAKGNRRLAERMSTPGIRTGQTATNVNKQFILDNQN